jgi:hypothetical protein
MQKVDKARNMSIDYTHNRSHCIMVHIYVGTETCDGGLSLYVYIYIYIYDALPLKEEES